MILSIKVCPSPWLVWIELIWFGCHKLVWFDRICVSTVTARLVCFGCFGSIWLNKYSHSVTHYQSQFFNNSIPHHRVLSKKKFTHCFGLVWLNKCSHGKDPKLSFTGLFPKKFVHWNLVELRVLRSTSTQ